MSDIQILSLEACVEEGKALVESKVSQLPSCIQSLVHKMLSISSNDRICIDECLNETSGLKTEIETTKHQDTNPGDLQQPLSHGSEQVEGESSLFPVFPFPSDLSLIHSSLISTHKENSDGIVSHLFPIIDLILGNQMKFKLEMSRRDRDGCFSKNNCCIFSPISSHYRVNNSKYLTTRNSIVCWINRWLLKVESEDLTLRYGTDGSYHITPFSTSDATISQSSQNTSSKCPKQGKLAYPETIWPLLWIELCELRNSIQKTSYMKESYNIGRGDKNGNYPLGGSPPIYSPPFVIALLDVVLSCIRQQRDPLSISYSLSLVSLFSFHLPLKVVLLDIVPLVLNVLSNWAVVADRDEAVGLGIHGRPNQQGTNNDGGKDFTAGKRTILLPNTLVQPPGCVVLLDIVPLVLNVLSNWAVVADRDEAVGLGIHGRPNQQGTNNDGGKDFTAGKRTILLPNTLVQPPGCGLRRSSTSLPFRGQGKDTVGLSPHSQDKKHVKCGVSLREAITPGNSDELVPPSFTNLSLRALGLISRLALDRFNSGLESEAFRVSVSGSIKDVAKSGASVHVRKKASEVLFVCCGIGVRRWIWEREKEENIREQKRKHDEAVETRSIVRCLWQERMRIRGERRRAVRNMKHIKQASLGDGDKIISLEKSETENDDNPFVCDSGIIDDEYNSKEDTDPLQSLCIDGEQGDREESHPESGLFEEDRQEDSEEEEEESDDWYLWIQCDDHTSHEQDSFEAEESDDHIKQLDILELKENTIVMDRISLENCLSLLSLCIDGEQGDREESHPESGLFEEDRQEDSEEEEEESDDWYLWIQCDDHTSHEQDSFEAEESDDHIKQLDILELKENTIVMDRISLENCLSLLRYRGDPFLSRNSRSLSKTASVSGNSGALSAPAASVSSGHSRNHSTGSTLSQFSARHSRTSSSSSYSANSKDFDMSDKPFYDQNDVDSIDIASKAAPRHPSKFSPTRSSKVVLGCIKFLLSQSTFTQHLHNVQTHTLPLAILTHFHHISLCVSSHDLRFKITPLAMKHCFSPESCTELKIEFLRTLPTIVLNEAITPSVCASVVCRALRDDNLEVMKACCIAVVCIIGGCEWIISINGERGENGLRENEEEKRRIERKWRKRADLMAFEKKKIYDEMQKSKKKSYFVQEKDSKGKESLKKLSSHASLSSFFPSKFTSYTHMGFADENNISSFFSVPALYRIASLLSPLLLHPSSPLRASAFLLLSSLLLIPNSEVSEGISAQVHQIWRIVRVDIASLREMVRNEQAKIREQMKISSSSGGLAMKPGDELAKSICEQKIMDIITEKKKGIEFLNSFSSQNKDVHDASDIDGGVHLKEQSSQLLHTKTQCISTDEHTHLKDGSSGWIEDCPQISSIVKDTACQQALVEKIEDLLIDMKRECIAPSSSSSSSSSLTNSMLPREEECDRETEVDLLTSNDSIECHHIFSPPLSLVQDSCMYLPTLSFCSQVLCACCGEGASWSILERCEERLKWLEEEDEKKRKAQSQERKKLQEELKKKKQLLLLEQRQRDKKKKSSKNKSKDENIDMSLVIPLEKLVVPSHRGKLLDIIRSALDKEVKHRYGSEESDLNNGEKEERQGKEGEVINGQNESEGQISHPTDDHLSHSKNRQSTPIVVDKQPLVPILDIMLEFYRELRHISSHSALIREKVRRREEQAWMRTRMGKGNLDDIVSFKYLTSNSHTLRRAISHQHRSHGASSSMKTSGIEHRTRGILCNVLSFGFDDCSGGESVGLYNLGTLAISSSSSSLCISLPLLDVASGVMSAPLSHSLMSLSLVVKPETISSSSSSLCISLPLLDVASGVMSAPLSHSLMSLSLVVKPESIGLKNEDGETFAEWVQKQYPEQDGTSGEALGIICKFKKDDSDYPSFQDPHNADFLRDAQIIDPRTKELISKESDDISVCSATSSSDGGSVNRKNMPMSLVSSLSSYLIQLLATPMFLPFLVRMNGLTIDNEQCVCACTEKCVLPLFFFNSSVDAARKRGDYDLGETSNPSSASVGSLSHDRFISIDTFSSSLKRTLNRGTKLEPKYHETIGYYLVKKVWKSDDPVFGLHRNGTTAFSKHIFLFPTHTIICGCSITPTVLCVCMGSSVVFIETERGKVLFAVSVPPYLGFPSAVCCEYAQVPLYIIIGTQRGALCVVDIRYRMIVKVIAFPYSFPVSSLLPLSPSQTSSLHSFSSTHHTHSVSLISSSIADKHLDDVREWAKSPPSPPKFTHHEGPCVCVSGGPYNSVVIVVLGDEPSICGCFASCMELGDATDIFEKVAQYKKRKLERRKEKERMKNADKAMREFSLSLDPSPSSSPSTSDDDLGPKDKEYGSTETNQMLAEPLSLPTPGS
ncbi:hypothetical protein ADUPG1_006202, partial [Aduncisulcus paluster]